MKRLPLLVAFVLFLGLCASLAYWALQLFAPAPRAVSAPPQAERKIAPITAAENLFGAKGQANTMANMSLRGVIHAGRKADSEAILVVGNEPPKYVKESSEVMVGVKVKEIHPRHVILDDHGVSREVSLPAFAPTPASAANLNANTGQPLQPANQQGNNAPAPNQQPAPSAAPPEQQPQQPQPQQPQPAAQDQSAPPANPGLNASGASGPAPSTARSATNPR